MVLGMGHSRNYSRTLSAESISGKPVNQSWLSYQTSARTNDPSSSLADALSIPIGSGNNFSPSTFLSSPKMTRTTLNSSDRCQTLPRPCIHVARMIGHRRYRCWLSSVRASIRRMACRSRNNSPPTLPDLAYSSSLDWPLELILLPTKARSKLAEKLSLSSVAELMTA